jgi:hypothetical protein
MQARALAELNSQRTIFGFFLAGLCTWRASLCVCLRPAKLSGGVSYEFILKASCLQSGWLARGKQKRAEFVCHLAWPHLPAKQPTWAVVDDGTFMRREFVQ